MKKLILCIMSWLSLISSTILAQTTYVPDNSFEQKLITLGYDDVLDNYVLTSNISEITSLDISNSGIANLVGIEHFGALKSLDCSRNQITFLDFSQNINLEFLSCDNNLLSYLNVSQNTSLNELWCFANQLTSLDVSQNTNLIVLNCDDNQLSSLDVSQNVALNYFQCGGNQFSILDVSQNVALSFLSCYNGQLTALDVTQNTALNQLNCAYNQINFLDLSQNTNLEYLNCENNQLNSLDVSHNTSLTFLMCYDNSLISLNLSNEYNENIGQMEAWNNPNLFCIQIDEGFVPNNNWAKDAQAEWSVDCELALAEFNLMEISIYPNPTSNIINIKTESNDIHLIMYNTIGKVVLESTSKKVNLSSLGDGLYFIKLHLGNYQKNIKIIKN